MARVVDIVAKAVLWIVLGLALIHPDLGHMEDKASGLRALTYPMSAFALPVTWWLCRRDRASFPWVPDLMVTTTLFTDILGNRMNLFDTVEWFDDWVHVMNPGFLSTTAPTASSAKSPKVSVRRSSSTPGEQAAGFPEGWMRHPLRWVPDPRLMQQLGNTPAGVVDPQVERADRLSHRRTRSGCADRSGATMGNPEGQAAASRKTYRYLRVGIVAMAVLLAASVVIEIASGSAEGILDSISAYYYTPVRGAFVGSLVAVGLGLVAIKGREGAEDIMLNLAGMLAPLVALVPTPISRTVAGFEVEQRTVPAVLVPYVENNVSALIVLGVVGLAFAWTTVARSGSRQRRDILGLTIGAALLAGLAVWFWAGRSSFLEFGHYAAAVPMFGLITAVAMVNARHAREAAVTSRLGMATYRRAYGAIAWGMGAIIAVAGALFLLETLDRSPFPSWLFWVEVALLALFAAFWVFQTAEHWDEGLPEGAGGPVSVPGPDAWPGGSERSPGRG